MEEGKDSCNNMSIVWDEDILEGWTWLEEAGSQQPTTGQTSSILVFKQSCHPLFPQSHRTAQNSNTLISPTITSLIEQSP